MPAGCTKHFIEADAQIVSRNSKMTREDFYQSYLAFKSWPIDDDKSSDETYEVELYRSGVSPPARILEIGFGAGLFLDWARRRGYSITGVEIIGELVDRARAAGHTVFHGTPQSVIDPVSEQFDLIVAFDVFEHLTVEELIDLLIFSRKILSSAGRILARFPNGGSPFGAYLQNSDITHVTTLSAERIRQVALAAQMRVLSVANAARPMAGRRARILKRGAYLLRNMVEWTIGHLYLGYRVPLDPNLTAILGMEQDIIR
jgi:2-polyprenyl-3-methyl-5-hydroxy-6-metoxy-1,4-benzoquinol methylase